MAWLYDFWNGANDCANSVATTVSTRAMSFKNAVLLSGFFNLMGAFITTEVAKTIGKGVILPNMISQELLIFSLIGAISWIYLSTKLGIPISVTHSLVGGLLGAGIVGYGFSVIIYSGIIKILVGMILAPVLGFLGGAILILILVWTIKIFSPNIAAFKLNQKFRFGQIFTTIAVAITHGMNDTQNAMGVITISLIAGGFLSEFNVPLWVILGSGIFMCLGTIYGGQRIIKTVGRKIYKVKPVHGISAELSSSILIFACSIFGIPVSTTQVTTAGVTGTGTVERKQMVKWREIIKIFFTWIFTIPGAALISGSLFFLFSVL